MRYWHSWPSGRGRRSGVSMPLAAAVCWWCVIAVWLVLTVIIALVVLVIISPVLLVRWAWRRSRVAASGPRSP